MDAARPPAPAVRRTGSLLALALLATTVLSTLTPAQATSSAPLVEVVVTSTSAGVSAAADAVRAAGGTVRDALPLVGGVSAELPAGVVLPPAFLVVEDHALSVASRKGGSTGVPTAVRTALGLPAPATGGAGITIAVVDTGIADSPDFAGRVTHVDVAGLDVDGDPYGHGTFVAGVIAGDGSQSDGEYAGVAPEADLLDVRVADEHGETDLSTVLRGLQVALDAGVDVVNLSLSSGSPLPYQIDPLTVALDRMWAAGIVVVVPTGNDGPGKGSVTSPGSDPTLLTVGASDARSVADRSDDGVPSFSGRGPAPQGVAKPDLVAPGTSLVSVRATGSIVDAQNPTARVAQDYFRGSGTSFATAAVSGAAALLLEQHTEANGGEGPTPDQVKAAVGRSAYAARGLRDARNAGAGGLDVAAALSADLPDVPSADVDLPPSGSTATWEAFLTAVLDGDRAGAVAAWDLLPDDTRAWAASRWAGLSPAASRWAANSWSASRWAGADGSADEWQMRYWAASRWAASRWASESFVASRWAANSWSASRWAGEPAASRWAEADFAASRWAASRWAASRWAASRWAAAYWG